MLGPMKQLVLIFLFFSPQLKAQVTDCFYDSFLGQFIVRASSNTYSMRARADFEAAKVDCSSEIAALYDGEKLQTWSQLSGLQVDLDVSHRYSQTELRVHGDVAAFYDGQSLKVITAQGERFEESSVFKKVPLPLFKISATLVAFYDDYDFYIFDHSLKTFKLHTLVQRSSFRHTLALLKYGAIIYDGYLMHIYCGGNFSRSPEAAIKADAKVLTGPGGVDTALRVGRAIFTLDTSCALVQLSGDYIDVRSSVLNPRGL